MISVQNITRKPSKQARAIFRRRVLGTHTVETDVTLQIDPTTDVRIMILYAIQE